MKRFLIWIRLNCPKAGFLFSQQGFSSTTPPGFLFRSDSSQKRLLFFFVCFKGDHKGVKVQPGSNKKIIKEICGEMRR